MKRMACHLAAGWFALGILTGVAWSQPAAAPPQAREQVWHGTLQAGPARLRLLFEWEATEDGGWKGKMTSIDQGNAKIPLTNVTFNDGQWMLEAKSVGGMFLGTRSDDERLLKGTWKQNGMEFPLQLEPGPLEIATELVDVWQGTIDLAGQELELQVRRLKGKDGAEEVLFDSLTQQTMGIAATLELNGQDMTLRVPSIMGKYTGTLNEAGDRATGTWEQLGNKFPLEFRKVDEPSEAAPLDRPQQPEKPYPYREEDARFENPQAGISLIGTLTLPAEKGGPFPAVVLVSGSGPQDRDESLMGHKPFLVIADYLTRQGIVVLRYDDRGTGESEGVFGTATTRDFAEDAAAAVHYLKSHAEVDANRIGIVGHSEGGLIAPIVASELVPDLAHIVLLAGPGVDGGVILDTQVKAIQSVTGTDNPSIGEQSARLAKIVQAIRDDISADEFAQLVEEQLAASRQEEVAAESEADETARAAKTANEALSRLQLQQMASPWFRYFITYDPIPTLERVRCPVLAMNGEKDLQVIVDVNLPAVEAALERAGNEGSRCVRLPGLNHLFQECQTGSPVEYQMISQTFDPAALEMIADWIKAH